MIPATVRPRAILAAAVTVALALGAVAGCTSAGNSAASHATASATPRTTPTANAPPVMQGPSPTTLTGFYHQHLTWVPCVSYFQCARIYVPFDYARPDGPSFSLPVIKLPAARPATRIGSLVINPGGPGGSGLEYAISARTSGFTQRLRDSFDIVGFDPRGVGGSEPALRCMSGKQLDAYLAINEAPVTAAQLAATEAANKGYAQACARNARSLLKYVGTPAAARDMDVLRAALGEAKLTYLGKSYGTALGAAYIHQFPRNVRAAVLDGAVAPSLSGTDMNIAQAQGFSVAFGQFVAWCGTRSGCPLHGTLAQATQQVSSLVTRANAHPLANEVPGGQQASGSMLLFGVASALYSKNTWKFLEDGLSMALNSADGSLLVELADSLFQRSSDGSYSNLSDLGTAVDCIDRPWPRSIGAWQSAASAAAKVSPLFGPALVYGSLPCAYWPLPAHPVLSGAVSAPGGAPPILVLGDLHDPATPYAWAVALAAWLRHGPSTRSALLGWNGQGHTSYQQGSACVDDAVDSYLISLQTPPNGKVCG